MLRRMAYLGDAIDAHLAAAVGDDAALFHELRLAFVEGATAQIDLLERSRCDGNWSVAALRLKSLASSFHANALADLAEDALSGAPGDPVVLKRMRSLLMDISPPTA